MSSALLLILAFSFSLANPAQNRANNRSFFFDDLKIGTWNTLGQPWFFDQYTDLQIAHIPRDLDVLHLTEVWTDEAKDRFLASKRVKETFPHSYFSKVQVGTPLGCAYAQDGLLEQYVGEFIGCLLAFGVNTQTVIETVPGMPDLCTQAQGQVGLYGIDPATGSYPGMECISCVIGAMMNLPNDQGAYGAITQCATPTNPQFTYGGQPGQLILSKHKIEDVKEVPFANGFIVATSNIYATINGFRVGFSHFAYNLFEGNSLLPPGFGAYFPYTTQPQQAQNFIAEKPDVCLGDLNSGDGPDGSFYQPEASYMLGNTSISGLVDVFHDPSAPDSSGFTCCPASHANFPVCVANALPPFRADHIYIRKSCKLQVLSKALWADSPLMSDHVAIKAHLRKWWFSPELEAKFCK